MFGARTTFTSDAVKDRVVGLRRIGLLIFASFAVFGVVVTPVGGASAVPPPPPPPQNAIYTASTSEIANPERGFFEAFTECDSAAADVEFTVAKLTEYRTVRNETLVQCVYYLAAYKNVFPLPQSVIDKIAKRLVVAKSAGVKLVMRFAYTKNEVLGDDAPLNVVLEHIRQLGVLLTAHKSAIHVVQEGFIGAYGEGASSQHFNLGDDVNGPRDWPARNAVLTALLNATPKSMMVQVRTPLMKQMLFGLAPLTAAEAYTGTNKARVGHYNDCFLNTDTDQGTYQRPTLQAERDYVAADTLYVPMGGETCGQNDDPPHDQWFTRPGCGDINDLMPLTQGPKALSELKRFHWNHINVDQKDIAGEAGLWQQQGCRQLIENSLGYRFSLVSSTMTVAYTYSGSTVTSRTLKLVVKVRNSGWSTPFSSRPVKLTVQRTPFTINPTVPPSKVTVTVPTDPRKWTPGLVSTFTVSVPVTQLMQGNYVLSLSLPDTNADLAGRSEYSIRLANSDTGTGTASTLKHTYVAPTPPPPVICNC